MDFKQQYIDHLVHTYRSASNMRESLPSADVAEEIVELVQTGWDIKIDSEDNNTRVEVDIPRVVYKNAEGLIKEGLDDVSSGLVEQMETAQSNFVDAFRAEMKTLSSRNPVAWPEEHWDATTWIEVACEMDCGSSVAKGLFATFAPTHPYVQDLDLPSHSGLFLDALARDWWDTSSQAWSRPMVEKVRAINRKGFDGQKTLNARFRGLWETCVVQYALFGKERHKSAHQQLLDLGVDIPATSINLQPVFAPDVDIPAALERLFEFDGMKGALLPSDTVPTHMFSSWSAMAAGNGLNHANVVALLGKTPALLDSYTQVVLTHVLETSGTQRLSRKI